MQKKINDFGIIRKGLFILLIFLTSISTLFMLLPIVGSNAAEENQKILKIAGILGFIGVVICIVLLVLLFTKTKETLSPDSYKKIKMRNTIMEMTSEEQNLLNAFEPKDGKEYQTIKKIYNELKPLWNEYVRSLLEQPIHFDKPMSTHAAAVLGTIIGGSALGMVYAGEAAVQMEKYKQNEWDVTKSKVLVGSLEEKVWDAYQMLNVLFSQCEKTNEMITNINEKVVKELKSKYTVTRLWYYW